jgi:hypothetical protein
MIRGIHRALNRHFVVDFFCPIIPIFRVRPSASFAACFSGEWLI